MTDTQRRDFRATYFIETPFPLEQAAEVLAGEQSSGTFVRVAGETDDLRRRSRAIVRSIRQTGVSDMPSLPNAFLERRGVPGPYRQAVITVSFPVDNVGANLPTLAATVGGNIYDLGEMTGVKLLSLDLPPEYVRLFEAPRHGVAGTRALAGRRDGPILGTIIKPNVGMTPEQTARVVAGLCDAGVDFIKDDECMANPPHSPLARRVEAVMRVINDHAQRTGRKVMYAFNISDDLDAMRGHAARVEAAGGTCVMASLNWCGFSAIQALRRSTPLAIHGHRNGMAAMSRHPGLGIAFPAYQALWRLAGVDQLHVNGLGGKFYESDESVIESARACLAPLAGDDAVMPVFSSGQWAGTVPSTFAGLGTDDLIFLSGGGILGHPDGAAAGVQSIRDAWDAARAGVPLPDFARDRPALAHALAFYG
ncbi:ribulose-bisphosphate carboxylase large subunit family protein [Bordetella bronchialis]|uniref:Ribulose 1,5-bisphosphate carboxylase n=1 Tax=Bordetella bronchialis TaxID=463025 RepID=A0A193G3Y8_9BORD|nr:ribulose-bisphosphate carboxylase large subunit family protein [Bordetella bronchialis]ANN74171.1 ribulose 1,5-bisphosphate carboxylase [Bordetella bronchialis]